MISAGVLFIQAPSLVFSGASIRVATSFSRTGAPLRDAMTMLEYSDALFSWSLVLIVYARVGPSKVPLGPFWFATLIVVRRSSRFRPYAARARGLTTARTAGRWPPLIL